MVTFEFSSEAISIIIILVELFLCCVIRLGQIAKCVNVVVKGGIVKYAIPYNRYSTDKNNQ